MALGDVREALWWPTTGYRGATQRGVVAEPAVIERREQLFNQLVGRMPNRLTVTQVLGTSNEDGSRGNRLAAFRRTAPEFASVALEFNRRGASANIRVVPGVAMERHTSRWRPLSTDAPNRARYVAERSQCSPYRLFQPDRGRARDEGR